MDRIHTLLLLARILTGAAIGTAVVFLYFTIDYLGYREKRLYFIDHRDSFVIILVLGILIGTIIGIGWAIGGTDQNK